MRNPETDFFKTDRDELEARMAENILNSEGVQLPTPGRVVWYENDGRGGFRYYLPAIVSVTTDNENKDAAQSGGIPLLESPTHVHLRVFSPGEPYTEHNVAYDPEGGARSWRWPKRS